ncbi:transposase, partial [Escherichia coli]
LILSILTVIPFSSRGIASFIFIEITFSCLDCPVLIVILISFALISEISLTNFLNAL